MTLASSVCLDEIVSIELVEDEESWDICIQEPDVYGGEPNFIANGLVVHNSGFHDMYCARKRGQEHYEIHALLGPILSSTYGLMVFQEQVMKILNLVGKIPLKDCEAVRKAISKKQVSKFQKYKNDFVRNGQETLGWSAEEVEKLWDSIAAFASYAFNLSHSVAYGYVSARMLYLKTHRPKGFFPAFINNFSPTGADDYRLMKEYLIETRRAGIKVERVHYNHSRARMKYENGCCHYPFIKVKGIGEAAAKRLEALQPYANYEDFLTRFGTDAKVNQSLIAIRAITDAEPAVLLEFYEAFKKFQKKQVETEKRFAASDLKLNEEVTKMTGRNLGLRLRQEDLSRLYVEFPEGDPYYKKIRILYKRYIRMLNNYERKKVECRPDLATFQPSGDLGDTELTKLLKQPQRQIDEQFIGFPWTHPVEQAIGGPSDMTFEDFDLSGAAIGGVDVLINKVEEHKAKKSGRPFYSICVEDATGRVKWVTVWERDFKQFEPEFVKGNIIRFRVQAPTGGFRSLTMAPAPGNKWVQPPRENDFRVVVIKTKEEMDKMSEGEK